MIVQQVSWNPLLCLRPEFVIFPILFLIWTPVLKSWMIKWQILFKALVPYSTKSYSISYRKKSYLYLVKSNQWSIINAVLWLVELLLGHMLEPTSSEKCRLWKPKQWRLNHLLLAKVVLPPSLWPTSWIVLKLLIPLTLMASESIAHEAEGLMGYWLRAHSSSRNNC